jgi:hypothetical protein
MVFSMNNSKSGHSEHREKLSSTLCVRCVPLFYILVRNSGRPHEIPRYSPVRSERVPGVI